MNTSKSSHRMDPPSHRAPGGFAYAIPFLLPHQEGDPVEEFAIYFVMGCCSSRRGSRLDHGRQRMETARLSTST